MVTRKFMWKVNKEKKILPNRKAIDQNEDFWWEKCAQHIPFPD